MPTIRQMNHLCNCKFCTQKTKCLICDSSDKLHRAHIVPRYLVDVFLDNQVEKEKWLSFDGENVFILCREHHREFDTFNMSQLDLDKIRSYIEPKIKEFVYKFDENYVKTAGRLKLEKWTKRINNLLYAGRAVVNFSYESTHNEITD